MFHKILIANRGEIACRVAATARRLGIATVAVYSEADAQARHVAMCDEAVLIGPAPVSDSYLRGERIIEAALATGAQAIHPGYGFLSENAEFAAACAAAGLVFIGPPPTAIEAMGSKSAAKTLMERAGVPLVPGYHGDNQDADFLQQQADRIGYPLLIKASAGGGGKGMRIVEQREAFVEALASCWREARLSFGDDKVLIEKYLPRARHIEMQVFADQEGNCIHLFERDCSVQRRHQKVLEEAPAPGMTAAMRQAMGAAAVAAAKAVGYVGAGTVEFIVDAGSGSADAFYFMEMNTRLQVEHPVTEMITGLDLVEWQLRVANGEPLPLTQDKVRLQGHAIEARLYAENPERGFLPAVGTLRHLHFPPALAFATCTGDSNACVRVDAGVREGDAISPYYDPMIAKLIVWAAEREAALAQLEQALAAVRIVGLATNVAFLQRLVASPAFAQADLDTQLIERERDRLFPPPAPASLPVLALAVAALLREEQAPMSARISASHDPWSQTDGWRLHGRLVRNLSFSDEAATYDLKLHYRAQGWLLDIRGDCRELVVLPVEQNDTVIRLNGQRVQGSVVRAGERWHVFSGGAHVTLVHADPLAHAGEHEEEAGGLTAPMPGKIVALLQEVGVPVEKGAPLLILEAMKMEHRIAAPSAGVVEEWFYAVGDQVAEGAALLAFKTVQGESE